MTTLTTLLIALVIIATTNSCNKDDDGGEQPNDPASQLPPATTTGAQTFGCLIGGEPFVPDRFGQGRPSAFYQFVDGAYTLGISGSSGGGESNRALNIGGIDVSNIEEVSYTLIEFDSGNFFAEYFIGGGFVLETSTTRSNPGKLVITNFDEENFILSGIFEFSVRDNNGNDINITEGRFDLNYNN